MAECYSFSLSILFRLRPDEPRAPNTITTLPCENDALINSCNTMFHDILRCLCQKDIVPPSFSPLDDLFNTLKLFYDFYVVLFLHVQPTCILSGHTKAVIVITRKWVAIVTRVNECCQEIRQWRPFAERHPVFNAANWPARILGLQGGKLGADVTPSI